MSSHITFLSPNYPYLCHQQKFFPTSWFDCRITNSILNPAINFKFILVHALKKLGIAGQAVSRLLPLPTATSLVGIGFDTNWHWQMPEIKLLYFDWWPKLWFREKPANVENILNSSAWRTTIVCTYQNGVRIQAKAASLKKYCYKMKSNSVQISS